MADTSKIDVSRISSGWRVEMGELKLDAESPHIDNGVIRTTLTVRNGTAIYFRDTANLTSLRARTHIMQQLADRGVTVEDRAMIALDEACRQASPSAGEDHEPSGQGQAITFVDDEDPPWLEPVDGASLLDAIAATYRRHLVLPKSGADILALWTVHTHAHDAATVSPLLALQSPQKRCGKTTTLQILSGMASRALPCSNITPAAIFRTVERYRPTLILDEADTYLSHEHDDLRGILNSGHTRTTAYVIRTVGDDHEPRRFCTWSPKAIALIGTLPSTLADRSITLCLQRKAPGEAVERWRIDHADRLTDLRRMARRWADDHHEALVNADPDVPDSLNDRAADNWRPLLAIAEAAGGEWPKQARQAIEATEDLEADDKDLSGLLLRDLRDLFSQRKTDRLASADICEWLASQEDRPWPTVCHGKPITQHRLAWLLGAYGITSTTVRIGDKVAKGYLLSGFEDPFARYISTPESVTTLQPKTDAALEPKSKRNIESNVTLLKDREPAPSAGCNSVTLPDQKMEDTTSNARPETWIYPRRVEGG